MCNDERQRIFFHRTNVNEMDVESVYVRDELRQGVQLRLAPAPIVICRPIAREFLHRLKLHALRFIRDSLLVRPPGGKDPAAEVDKVRLRNVDVERADCASLFGRGGCFGPGGSLRRN